MRTSRIALLGAVASVALLSFSSRAHADGTLGRTTVGVTPSSGMSADYKRGSKFTLSENAALRLICAYLDSAGGGSGQQRFRYVVYRDSGGAPGAKVAETNWNGVTAVPGASGGRWICETPGPMPLSPGNYWLMIHTSGNAGILRYYYDGPADWYGNADNWADGAADPFGSGGAGGGTVSIYATYTTNTQTAGRTTVGTLRSSPVSNDFKRASSFTVTGTGGVVRTGAIYLDGLGGGSGQSFPQVGIYRDANGVPGALLTRGSAQTVFAGEPGLWRSIGFLWEQLAPGKYWLALQTVGDGGTVTRYALDGTGNWYGNPASPMEVISDPFGPGSTGNGTISGFVSYQPGTFTTSRFGRTTPAVALKGLSANYIRGSKFHLETNKEAAVTALWAYLDGKGGATGSQAIRMALYAAPNEDTVPWPTLIADSSTVNIAAGTAPGWVRFAMPTTLVFTGDFLIMIHTGDGAAVARSYGDGAANWTGRADVFSDGSDDEMRGALDVGTVTLAVNAEYEEFTPQ